MLLSGTNQTKWTQVLEDFFVQLNQTTFLSGETDSFLAVTLQLFVRGKKTVKS